jgi:hypothetical protein
LIIPFIKLRTYTATFAKAVIQMIPDMQNEGSTWTEPAPWFCKVHVHTATAVMVHSMTHSWNFNGHPCFGEVTPSSLPIFTPLLRVAQVDLTTPLPELFGKLEWSELPEANLADCLLYLRGCDKLRIPAEFRPYLPTEWLE